MASSNAGMASPFTKHRDEERTYANTLGALDRLGVALHEVYTLGPFLSHVAPDPALRDALVGPSVARGLYRVRDFWDGVEGCALRAGAKDAERLQNHLVPLDPQNHLFALGV